MKEFGLFIGTLLQSRTQAHIYHWQTVGVGSNAKHQALGSYYEDIVDILDKLVESYQGRYGIYRGYEMPNPIREDDNHVQYFESLCKFVETIRKAIPQDSYIQNQVDEIVTLIESTKFKLKNLQ
jgi:DNA-binding ferritin-like protein